MHNDDPAFRSTGRLAGALYLVIAASGFFSILYVPSQLHIAGNALATLDAIAARPGLFGMGVLGDVVMMTAEVAVSVLLFQLFRRAGETLALIAMVARLLMAATMAAMLLFQGAVMRLALGDAPLEHLDMATRADLAQVFIFAHDAGVWVWQVFFALHLVILGLLVIRSGLFHRLLGLGLSIGGLGYAFDSVRAFAFPHSEALMIFGGVLLAVATVAEIGFAIRLLWGGRSQRLSSVPA